MRISWCTAVKASLYGALARSISGRAAINAASVALRTTTSRTDATMPMVRPVPPRDRLADASTHA